ncbi:MAG: sensor histidine kinase [Verrucomicrobia bacterium]|nr:sensor histidine kinase [Verrucomicrobiota bacterium]
MSFTQRFERQSPIAIAIEMVLLVSIVGFIDYITGYELSLFLFYGPPIYFTAWFCDKKTALLVALLAGITWWWADFAAGHPYMANWYEGWEVMMRLGFFIFVAIGSSALRARRDIAEARLALLEHSRRLEKEIVTISERERQRVGQDLHDGLCQYLAALGYAAAALQEDLERLLLPAEAARAAELTTLLQDAVMQTRNLARGLVPVETSANGLASALEELADSVARLTRIDCRFQQDDEIVIADEATATHLFRIAQEAINNALKHAGAQQIRINLSAEQDGCVVLEVADNGVGIGNAKGGSGGIGLNILQYRANCIGGNLRISQLPEGGTSVRCSVPQKREATAMIEAEPVPPLAMVAEAAA